jgi:hypothetical protein
MSIRTFILLLSFSLSACSATNEAVDAVMAKRAEVVMRVRRLSPGEGSKYWWYDVEVLKVLKNDSAESFTNKLSVAAYGGKPGVPAGVSTIYLERYNPTEKKYWKLVGGEASTGVSHNTK